MINYRYICILLPKDKKSIVNYFRLNMKRKILFCGEFPRKNSYTGSATVNVEIISHLIKDGSFEIQVLGPVFDNEEIIDVGFPVHFLKTKYFRSKGFGDLLARFSFHNQVLKFLRQTDFKPDLIHIDANPYLCRIKPNIPKVLFLHGSEKSSQAGIAKWTKTPYSSLCNALSVYYERKAFYDKNVRRVFINSQYSKDLVVSGYKLPEMIADKIRAVRLGQNIKRFGLNDGTKKENKTRLIEKFNIGNKQLNPFLLFVGGISSHKGQVELIESVTLLMKDFPFLGLILVGKDAGDMANCQKAIKNLNLENNVFIVGGISDNDLGTIFRAADIYASAATEGFGINQVEGMAMGLPLVARDKGAVKELFKNNEAGFLVNNRNDFIDKIKLLAKDDGLRLKMGEAAREYSKNMFSWEKLGSLVAETYSEIIEKLSA